VKQWVINVLSSVIVAVAVWAVIRFVVGAPEWGAEATAFLAYLVLITGDRVIAAVRHAR
jgi:hypothetical protein